MIDGITGRARWATATPMVAAKPAGPALHRLAVLSADRKRQIRWAACIALGLHAAAAWWLLQAPSSAPVDLGPPIEIVMEMGPEPRPPAPLAEPEPPPPGPPVTPSSETLLLPEPTPPEQPGPEPAPNPPGPAPVQLAPDPILPQPLPQPRPPPRPRPKPPSPPRTTAPSAHETKAPIAPPPRSTVEPSPGPVAAPLSSAVPDWRTALVTKLQRAKRYPETARSRGLQGVASATFTMDRAGRVLAASLVSSSGSAVLDDEALAMIRRAEPLPPPPPELQGAMVTMTIPVSFTLR